MSLTVESLALDLAKAVQPLTNRLAAGEIEPFFAELGLPAPAVVFAAPGVVSAIRNTATDAGQLPPKITTLSSAINDQNVNAIVSAVQDIVPAVRKVITGIEAITDAINTAASGAALGEIRQFAAELPERLLSYLIATYLERAHPVISGVAGLLGIVEATAVAATAAAPAHVRRIVRFDQISELLDDPLAALADLYRWGAPDFDWDFLIERLAGFANRIVRIAFVQPDPDGGPPVLRLGFVDVGLTDDALPGVRASTRVDLAEQRDISIPLRPGFAFEIGLTTALGAGTAIDVIPPGELRIDPPTAEVSGQTRIGFAASDPDRGELSLLGIAGGSGIRAKRIRAAVGADVAWDVAAGHATGGVVIEAAIEDGSVVIDLSSADGFLSAILPDGGLRVPFDVLAGWSSTRGVYFVGGAGLAIDIPVDIELGPIKVQMLHLRFTIGGVGLELEASGAISAALGPFAMTVDRMGTTAVLSFPDSEGNLGPADLDLRFKPPSGIGLALDAGVVKGGGYLDRDPVRGEYAGVLELSFGVVSIKAIGILTTKLPGGAKGWALLLLVFGEFSPVQLGFGFTLNGVGGIIGLQHGVSIEALQSGLRTGALDAVLFPADPVANAPTLIAQLRVIFPIVPRALTVGPALKIGWSTPALVTITLGIILQFDDVLGGGPGSPSFSRIVLVGQIKVQVPPVDELGADTPALIQLQVDLVGAYDVQEQELSIDAVLRDSHVAGMPLTGSLVVRARFGADPTFILAVGGFHPRFNDLPPGLPPQERVGIQLRYGIVTVRIVGYVAITSNSFQIGADASLVAAGGGFRVEAFLGFDALFVFQPYFHFEIDFRVGAAIKYKRINLASIKVRGTISGPGRWEIEGHATISVLFFDVDIDFEVAWGDSPTPTLPSVAVAPLIKAALESPESWHAELPSGDPLVTLRAFDASGEVVAHPLSALVGMQKVVPLGLDIDRVGRSRPSDGSRFNITAASIGGVDASPDFRTEHFARAEFVDLSEEDKLSKPSFERFRAGVAVSSDEFALPAATSQVVFEPEWETLYLRQDRPADRHVVDATILVAHARLGAVAQSKMQSDRNLKVAAAGVSVAAAGFAVATERRPGQTVAGGDLTFTEAEQASAHTSGSTFVVDAAETVIQP